jgi:hypothetical protein
MILPVAFLTASVTTRWLSISLDESISRFTAENPMIHPVLATIAA